MPKGIEQVIQENRSELMTIKGAYGISIDGFGDKGIIVHVKQVDDDVKKRVDQLKPGLDGYSIRAIAGE